MSMNKNDIITAAQERMIALFENRKTATAVLEELTETLKDTLKALKDAGLRPDASIGHLRSVALADSGDQQDVFTRAHKIAGDVTSTYQLQLTFAVPHSETRPPSISVALHYHHKSLIGPEKTEDRVLFSRNFKNGEGMDEAKDYISRTIIDVASRMEHQNDPGKDPRQNKRFKRALTP